jgi:Uma2 family endonuclease
VSQRTRIESQPAEELSLADWAALPEDAQGELVDGRLTEEEVSDYVHEILVIAIGSILRAWILPRGGRVAGSDAKLAVSSERGRKPDLTVYLPGRLPPRRGLIRTPPDVAVEILTPTPRDERCDRVEKVGEYARFGVRSYWIVDTELRSLEILELGDDGRYVHALSATGGVLESIPGCEGLTLDLDALWDEIDWSETQ